MYFLKQFIKPICLILFAVVSIQSSAQEGNLTQTKTRKIHYAPDGNSFILKNGKRKFNRALYGTNTGFRIEVGDLPEFALYLPGMGGNFKLGIANESFSKWISESDSIVTRYNPGEIIYEIRDTTLQNGIIKIQVVAHAKNEAMIIKVETENISKSVRLMWLYGGASGNKFSRDGDIGADPETVFYLQPEYCINNDYKLYKNQFLLNFGSETNKLKTGNNCHITGVFPKSIIKIVNVDPRKNPIELFESNNDSLPAIIGKIDLKTKEKLFWKIENIDSITHTNQKQIETEFNEALQKIEQLTARVILKTPDAYINTLGSALAIAGDAIWEYPAYLHGAIAWRMHLNAWRGAYVADPLGWHDRAETHFKSYAKSQVLEPETGHVVLDTFRNFARQKEVMGTTLFSSGYISRNPNNNTKAHHYDMNSVFINQVLRHYQWTGDIEFIKTLWPVVKRHIAWEKRNFDADNDGIYDAYASIWASDALEYSGGGVTYASAYNYSCNVLAASIAKMLNEDPEPYVKEAKHIKSAIESNLWITEKGVFGEYKDLLGNQLLHGVPGLWTIYHSLDEGIADSFQAFEALRYVDTEIPHIPVKAEGLPITDLYLLSTSNWQPYTWSVNNVALAENLHAALAYWQGGRSEEAFKLWQSALIESMYLGASPGGFEQLSYYDAMRGELYRDFADPIGMAARSLVEGLFGVQPNAIENTLFIKPGFPKDWNEASLEVPDIKLTYSKENELSRYLIVSNFNHHMALNFSVDIFNDIIEDVKINDKRVSWKLDENAIGNPKIIIESPYQKAYNIEIKYKGDSLEKPIYDFKGHYGESFQFKTSKAEVVKVFDPQNSIAHVKKSSHQLDFKIESNKGNKTFFIQLKQNNIIWWQPVYLTVIQKENSVFKFQNWDEKLPERTNFEIIALDSIFNCKITNIFEQQYLSPRPTSPTLQIPIQGIGNWCYPFIKPSIDDSGLRKKAGVNNMIFSPQNIPFKTPSDTLKNNIAFVSHWDNFPKEIYIPLTGTASHAFFMLAGTTNPMQSRFVNGAIEIKYTDGTMDVLELKNPENWWPIEQDYFIDGLAFTTNATKPPRVYLKTGTITRDFKDFKSIKGFTNFGIDGGAATILDLPLNKNKKLQSLTMKAVANEVVIGLMSLTLIRE